MKKMTHESILDIASTTPFTYSQISYLCKKFDVLEKAANDILNMAMRCGIKFDVLESSLWMVTKKSIK